MAEPAAPSVVAEARGLRKRYGEVEALSGADLRVAGGEFVAILGPSGSGKSTLLNLLGLLDRPTSGEVLLFGTPTSGLPEAERAELRNRRIGFVFQFDSLLPEFTVLENVMMPGRVALRRRGASLSRVEGRARELLCLVDLLEKAERFPAQLSGGERQRAAIARALLNEPALVLADEPTGNLDRRNGELVFGTMARLAESLKVGLVLVTHNESAAGFATRRLRLADGRFQDGEGGVP